MTLFNQCLSNVDIDHERSYAVRRSPREHMCGVAAKDMICSYIVHSNESASSYSMHSFLAVI